MVGELLGGALVLIGVTMLLLRHRIGSSADGPPSGVQTPGWNKQGLANGRRMALVCSLLILGGTALVLGAALT